MTITGFDHIEFYVGDLAEAVSTLLSGYGFRLTGRETPAVAAAGQRSSLFRQGQVKIVLTCATSPDHPAPGYVSRHGDGVAVIAFQTDDVRQAFSDAVAGGATPVSGPVFTGTGDDSVGTAEVSGFGDIVHRLVQRTGRGAEFAPGTIEPAADDAGPEPPDRADGVLVRYLDHVAACLPAGLLDKTVDFYRDAFGLNVIFDERIEVGGQAMISKVVQDKTGRATFTLIEPDLTREPGQIDDFLQAHDGAGVQHLALGTSGIAEAVRRLSARGVPFLSAPDGYYRALEGRLGTLAIPVEVLREFNVLADRDQWGQMFQIFTRSRHKRSTFFFELIERQGALTFGTNNIHALYEALDTEQAKTGQVN
jgi:4-hydroxymandelate synthase